MKKATVLVLFVAALAGAVLIATERARPLDVADATPPVGSISLPAVVRSHHVVVTATLTDPDTGVIELRLSNAGSTWSGWQGFPSPAPDGLLHLSWSLSRGTGTKTVVLEARNGAGLIGTFRASTVLEPAVAASQ